MALMLVSQFAFSQNLSDVISEYATKPNVNAMVLPQSMLKMFIGQMMNRPGAMDKIKKMAPNANPQDVVNHLVENIDSVRFLSLDDCAADVKSSFIDKTKDLSVYSYNKVDDYGPAAIYSKDTQGSSKEIVVIIKQDSDCDFIQFYGKLTADDVKAVIASLSNIKG